MYLLYLYKLGTTRSHAVVRDYDGVDTLLQSSLIEASKQTLHCSVYVTQHFINLVCVCVCVCVCVRVYV